MSRQQQNTATGAVIGGVAGNLIGGDTGSTLGGAALGMLAGLWLNDPTGALLGLHSYNPALAALALSQYRRQPWLPLLGILLACLLAPGFAGLHLAPLTAPFILACWLVRATLRLRHRSNMDSPFESP